MKISQTPGESEIFASALEYVRSGFSVIPVKGMHYANPEDAVRDSKVPLVPWA